VASGKEHAATTTGDEKKGGLRGKLKKVVLAYSGGLDTSVIVPWLRYTCFLFHYGPYQIIKDELI
jgi:argininosuccinate synthase